MSQENYDVIVLGVGGMGAAAAFELARRGRRVLGLEQFSLGHDRGSSHGQTRIIRKAYFEHPNYVPLLHRAYQRWYELEQLQGRHLFTECGVLSIGTPQCELIQGVQRSAREHGLHVESIAGSDLRRRYPAFQFGDEYVGALERDAGFLYVEDCVVAYAEEARRLGAELRPFSAVTSWQATPTGVVVRTEGQEYAAQRLVITAGAWTSQVLGDLGLPLTVRRKVLHWFGTSDDRLFRRDVFPCYMVQRSGSFFYGFPVLDANGLKVARHDEGLSVADPSQLDRNVTSADEEECRGFLRQHLPAVGGSLRFARVCMYTMTPDEHFIIDVHPAHPQVAIAAGFSGHGFKFAAVVGEILADLSDKGHSELPIGMFSIGRFK
ncbi:MAG: N-methyl-L-tryptophan oxidase [Gemmataceae bacterium]|nr:N-methyl-L-tryptophan oxidase [Gemmataceae bacterium]